MLVDPAVALVSVLLLQQVECLLEPRRGDQLVGRSEGLVDIGEPNGALRGRCGASPPAKPNHGVPSSLPTGVLDGNEGPGWRQTNEMQ
ncbi:MAG: hypothetical protein OES57_12640 [Acidimicrobiia bacterium]|nr:hypothetical protein [Acidimicrobiia bacterium]